MTSCKKRRQPNRDPLEQNRKQCTDDSGNQSEDENYPIRLTLKPSCRQIHSDKEPHSANEQPIKTLPEQKLRQSYDDTDQGDRHQSTMTPASGFARQIIVTCP
jgi:hypothetical protein